MRFCRLLLRAGVPNQAARPTRTRATLARRAFHSTAIRPARKEADKGGEEDEGEGEGEVIKVPKDVGLFLQSRVMEDGLTAEEREVTAHMLKEWESLGQERKDEMRNLIQEVRDGLKSFKKMPNYMKQTKVSFWNEDEVEPDMLTNGIGEDDFEEDDITSMGHGKLEEHREYRQYARLAVWEMPLLAKFAKDFEPPKKDQPLRFRYTTYMGEFHPAERKVVVEFCPSDLPVTPRQQLKLMKLVGARYNPEKNIVKMSCELFEHQAQNKRYLGDMVNKLIIEAKDPSDTFEDIPLDTRHHTFVEKPKFPREWRMTEERRQELDALREQNLRLDEQKRAEGLLVDGNVSISRVLTLTTEQMASASHTMAAEIAQAIVRRRVADKRS